ncbi:MAG TPA: LLM class flavin-dependent oxidoreductase [Actinobacteria bacterium]|nr:LLM class flavin-dependent oxidoreductase [Actinomycetota bacterium]
MSARRKSAMHFGVNLNNREPLIAPQYSLQDLLDLSTVAEAQGFDSVWVGDSLFSKPRYEAISLLAAISQRTNRVKLGTACLVTSTRNPLYLALEWATLDALSNGRTILGACMGNPEVGVRREFAALGLEFKRRAGIFEEGLSVLRSLWTEGSVSIQGEHFAYDDVAFYSGTEMGPLMPVQSPPPIWVVSNIRLLGDMDSEVANRRLQRACRRIVELGEGWMTCCRAQHPEEVVEQLGHLNEAAAAMGVDISDYAISYQVTMNIADSSEEAEAAFGQYISQYYPELSQSMDLANWGPVGTPDQIVEWLDTFRQAGVTHFVCRFGDLDQFGQVQRFAEEVLPRFDKR